MGLADDFEGGHLAEVSASNRQMRDPSSNIQE